MTNQSDLIREAIVAANRKFEATFKTGKPEAMAGLYSEDAILMPPNSEPLEGRDSIVQFWALIMGMGIKQANLLTTEVDAQGATAIETGAYRLFGENNTVLDRGKYIVVWKLYKGEWKFHRDIWNTSMPPRR